VKILAIDTSGKQAGVAIVENGRVLGKITVGAHTGPGGWKHSQMLLPTVISLLGDTGLALADVGCIAYTCGPGSFTGLRIGAATALGLARGAGLRVVQVPTLDAMAYNYIMSGEEKVLAMMDARRGQVYAAVYGRGAYGEMVRTTDYLAAPLAEVVALAGDAKQIMDDIDPGAVGLLAEKIPMAPGSNAPEGKLLYIRAPQAVREASQKQC